MNKAEIPEALIQVLKRTKYQCGECNFITTNPNIIMHHSDGTKKHNGIRHTCDQCELNYSNKQNMMV